MSFTTLAFKHHYILQESSYNTHWGKNNFKVFIEFIFEFPFLCMQSFPEKHYPHNFASTLDLNHHQQNINKKSNAETTVLSHIWRSHSNKCLRWIWMCRIEIKCRCVYFNLQLSRAMHFYECLCLDTSTMCAVNW